MITYDLAEKLKNAGFPQKDRGFIFLFVKAKPPFIYKDHWKYFYCRNTKENGLPNAIWLYVPTLSELIEICNVDDFLLRDFFTGDGKIWIAGDYMPYENDFLVKGTGDSPEEAVINLWLALQANH